MRIVYPQLDLLIELSEETVTEIIVENQCVFLEILEDLNNQYNGMSGSFVLSKDNEILKISKNIELLTNFVPFEINKKELLTKLYDKIKKKSVDGYTFEKTNSLILEIEKYIYEIFDDFDNEISITLPEDIAPILKMFGVRFSDNYTSLCEKIIEYMINVRSFLLKNVFVTVNMRSYVSDDECEKLFKTLCDHKVILIALECCERKKLEYSNRIIIDGDMCVI